MNKILNTTLFIVILLIAFITRFYKLGESPNGLYVDEASIGYNAYSILQTGKDEFGKSFPIVFRSFNDFKTPIYVYFSIPFIKLFGLSAFSVRLLSAITSFLTIPLLYLLLREILKIEKLKKSLLFLASALLAISPWHIYFGRAAFESNLALFLFLFSTYLFYLALKKPWFLVVSALMYALTITSYHSLRLITPIFLTILFLRYKKHLLSRPFRWSLISSLVVGVIVLLPTLMIINTPGFLARASGLNIFNYNAQHPAGFIEGFNGFISQIINFPVFLSLRELSALYLAYFSPRNLFFLGDPDVRTAYPGLATFFIWQLPFYFIGLYSLVARKQSAIKFFTITMLLLSPLPAALTRDPFSTIRSLPLVIPLIIVIAIGILDTVKFVEKILVEKKLSVFFSIITVTCCLILVTYSLLKLYSSGIILSDYYKARQWNYGFQELTQKIKLLDNGIPIIFDNARVEPYSELLFYLKFDPETYQKSNFEIPLEEYYTNLDRNKHKIIGSIETRGINWEEDTKKEKYFVGDVLSISDEQIANNKLTLIGKILYPDTSVAFVIVKTNP